MKLFSFLESKVPPTAQELIARKIEIEAELAKLNHPIDDSSTIGRQVATHRKALEEELLNIEAALDKLLEASLHSKNTPTNTAHINADEKYSAAKHH